MKRFVLMKNFVATRTLIFVTALFTSLSLKANDFVLHHITTVDGLSHNEVRLVRETNDGLLWFGTQNGLCAYDGYRYKVFKSQVNDPNSISGDKIYSMAPSQRGGIWIGTTQGLNYISSLSEDVQRWEDTLSVKSRMDAVQLYYLYEDMNGELWTVTSSGNYLYNPDTNALKEVFSKGRIKCCYHETNGSFWVRVDNQLLLYDLQSQTVIHSYPIKVNQLVNDRYGVLWAVSDQHLYRFHPDKNKFELVVRWTDQTSKVFDTITADAEGNLWMGSYGGGVMIYLRREKQLVSLQANPLYEHSLSSNDVYSVFIDHSGVVWIGTQEGLDYFDWSRHRFRQWQHIPGDTTSLSSNFIQAIIRDDLGRLLVGTRDAGVEQVIENDSKLLFRNDLFTGENNQVLKRTYVGGMLYDSKERLWMCGWDNGLFLQEGEGDLQRFVYQQEDEFSLASNGVLSAIEDQRGRIWIGTHGGLCMLDESEDNYQFKRFTHDQYNTKSISLNSIYKVFEDSKGRIWLAINNGGVNLLHEEKDGNIWFERFMYDAGDPASISSNEAFVVFEDSKQQLWVGTSSGGFNKVIEQQKDGQTQYSFKAYTEEDGLADNEVNSILEDEYGTLWIGTNKGLSRFDPEKETFTNYGTYDGVVKGKFRKNAAWRDKDGTMYFGGAGGVNVFRPVDFPLNTAEPKVKFVSLKIDGEEVKPEVSEEAIINQPLNSGGNIALKWPANRFELEISALSYASSWRNKYQWKLEGVEDEWNHYEGTNPVISYANLPTGTYRLLVKSANNDGIWMQNPVWVKIEISRHRSLLFLWIGLIVIFLLVLVIVSIHFKNKRRQTAESTIADWPEEVKTIISQLDGLMTGKKLYLNSNLGLDDLAEQLQVSSNQLSAVLNDYMGKNFYEYVNEFRVEEVKRMLVDPENKGKNILTIAWDCGFNSKSAFNRIFKANTGTTPTAYQKQNL